MSRTHKDCKEYWRTQPDKTKWWRHNIPSCLKRVLRKIRRAKENHAVRKGQEVPVFKNNGSRYW